jgi:membrane protease YdiL (CAAX protease family)
MAGREKHHQRAAPETPEAICTVEVGWGIILLFVAANSAVLVLLPFARLSEAGMFLRGANWWENLNLFGVLLGTSLFVALGVARMRPTDLGLRWDKALQAVLVTLASWCVMQAWPYLASGSAEIARTWYDPGRLATVRWALVMFLATALWEELAFRGFLLPQVYLKLRGPHVVRFWAALILSQLVFAAAHIPAHIMIRHLSALPLLHMVLLQGFAGLLLGLLYFRTRNLWVCVGIHGLANAPTPLFGGAMTWELPLVLILLGWPWLTHRRRGRGLAPIVTTNSTPPVPTLT